MIEIIKADLLRITEKATISSFIRWMLFPQGSTFPHDVWFRILQFSKKNKIAKYTVGLLVYIIERHFSLKYGVHINSNIEIGPGLKVVHPDGVYLNCEKIGNNFTVFPGVMLGAKGDNKTNEGVPKVGNNVTVYTGAVIVGNVTLHDGCVVGANSYVDKDVPENTVVAGLPAYVIKHMDTL